LAVQKNERKKGENRKLKKGEEPKAGNHTYFLSSGAFTES
jgi:hypothetical protein